MLTQPPPIVLIIHPRARTRAVRLAAVRQLGCLAGAAASAGEVGMLRGGGLIPDVIVFDDATEDMSPTQFGEELLRRLGDAAPPVVYMLTSERGESSIPSPPLRPGFDAVLERPVRARDALCAVLSCAQRGVGADGVLRVGELGLDVMRRVVSLNGRSGVLTRLETLLLEYLMRRAGRPVSCRELLERVWGFEPDTGAPEVVRAHVRNLRGKLEGVGADRQDIVNLPGRGYMLEVDGTGPLSAAAAPVGGNGGGGDLGLARRSRRRR
jgi:DNA-binding response OmpR family regulator